MVAEIAEIRVPANMHCLFSCAEIPTSINGHTSTDTSLVHLMGTYRRLLGTSHLVGTHQIESLIVHVRRLGGLGHPNCSGFLFIFVRVGQTQTVSGAQNLSAKGVDRDYGFLGSFFALCWQHLWFLSSSRSLFSPLRISRG